MMSWKNRHDLPSQDGRIAIVTGANSGIGYETARALALKGAAVTLACRSETRGADALARLREANPVFADVPPNLCRKRSSPLEFATALARLVVGSWSL